MNGRSSKKQLLDSRKKELETYEMRQACAPVNGYIRIPRSLICGQDDMRIDEWIEAIKTRGFDPLPIEVLLGEEPLDASAPAELKQLLADLFTRDMASNLEGYEQWRRRLETEIGFNTPQQEQQPAESVFLRNSEGYDMVQAAHRYRQLCVDILKLRRSGSADEETEAALLDEAADLWELMTEEEQTAMNLWATELNTES